MDDAVPPGPETTAVDLRLDAGTTVEVQCRFDQRWSGGFTVVDVTDEGYRIRRQSDGSVLPVVPPRTAPTQLLTARPPTRSDTGPPSSRAPGRAGRLRA